MYIFKIIYIMGKNHHHKVYDKVMGYLWKYDKLLALKN